MISVSIVIEMTWGGYQNWCGYHFCWPNPGQSWKEVGQKQSRRDKGSPALQIGRSLPKGVDLSREWGQGQPTKKQISMHVHVAQCNEHISINSWRQRAQFVLFLAETILSLSPDRLQGSQVVRILSRMNVMVNRTLGIK